MRKTDFFPEGWLPGLMVEDGATDNFRVIRVAPHSDFNHKSAHEL